MDQYYRIEQTPGVKSTDEYQAEYSYLDDPSTLEKLLDFSDGETARIRFILPQIHCASCIWLLENLTRLHPGIQQSTVNFLKKEAHVIFSEKEMSLREVAELLHRIGYPPKVSLQDVEEEKGQPVDRSLIYKLGVTGFVFGNVMLLSFPEYLGLNQMESEFQRAFGYIILALGVPLVFYSGVDYLRSAWLGLKEGELNIDVPISIGILSLFGRSTYEILSHTGAGYFDSLAGLLFFLLIGKWFQQKTYYTLSFERDYKSYFPLGAKVCKDEQEISKPLHQLDKDDIIIVRNGELIPADGILVDGKAAIDYSFVTGESAEVRKEKGDKIFAGGRQRGSSIKMVLTKKVAQSYLVQLWNERAFKEQVQKNTASELAKKVGKYFTIAILLIAFATLAYWLPKDMSTAINAFSAVLIIACPCAVALSIPFTFGNALRLLARDHFYLKHTTVIEALQQITYIIFDKTGTLTSGGKDQLNWIPDPEADLDSIPEYKHHIAALANQSSHPRSRQIVQLWGNGNGLRVEDYKEIPGQGIQGIIAGTSIKIGNADFIFGTENSSGDIQQGTFTKVGTQVLGHFTHESRTIPGLENLISKLQANYPLGLLSGDGERDAPRFRALLGEEASLAFHQSPKDKLEHIRQLQEQGETVLMIGDGLNDAGALQQANVGIVVSENTSNFTPACDAVLRADQLIRLPFFLRYAQQSLYVVFGAYALALVYNVVGLSFAVQGTLSPVIAAILMPASSITIVVFGVLGSWWFWKRGEVEKERMDKHFRKNSKNGMTGSRA